MRKGGKLLSAAISALFVFSTISWPTGKLINAKAGKPDRNMVTSYQQESKEEISKKISKELLDEFKTNEKAKFIVKLKSQVDTVKTAKEAETKSKKQGVTAYKTKLIKKSTIVSELRMKADETQSDIKTYLDNQKKNGNVTEYRSYYIINGLAVTGTEAVVNKIAAMPEVESIQPDTLIKLDDQVKTVKASSNSNVGSNIEQIGAPEVWKMGIDGTGVVIASIDTGVQWNHPALQRKYRGYNPSNPNVPNNECNWFDATSAQGPDPYDDEAHGTHTMGTMVGSEADGTNKIGVAPGAKWISAKAFSAKGGYTSDILSAGQWILAPTDKHGTPHPELAPDIVNNSWGGEKGVSDIFRQMVQAWKSSGIFPEFSAGNTSQYNPGGPGSVLTPASYPEAFATGSVDANNNISNFSLLGPSPYGVLKPDVTAPGEYIRSSVPIGSYQLNSGTSMAGPHVSGTAALLLEADSSLTVDQLEDIIRNTATPRTDSQYTERPNNEYGYGVVNAYNAVHSLLSQVGQVKGYVSKNAQDTVPPTFKDDPVTQAFAGIDVPISIDAQDDVFLRSVELQYVNNDGTEWNTIAAVETDGDYKHGTYKVVIPGDHIVVSSLKYRWRIVDCGNNEVYSSTYTVPVASGITDGYFTDFESKPIGWTTSGTKDWVWGTPSGGIGKAASGEKVYATNLYGNYEINSDMYLVMPTINLPQGSSYLQFKQWYGVEDNFDKCYVKVSADKHNWTTLATYTGSAGNDYAASQIDLSAYAGQKIYIAFNLKSDDSKNASGWFIDDVGLSSQSKAASSMLKSTLNKTAKVSASRMETSGIPVNGMVTVVETGASANTNPLDGSYTLTQKGGDYTLKAEAYGAYPNTQKVHIENGSVTDKVNFMLEPLPHGILTGKVTDIQTGKPIKNVKLYLIEDSSVEPVYTDDQGNYSFTAYDGSYTLDAFVSGYDVKKISVSVRGNETITQNIQMSSVVGYANVIGYDDGTAENGISYINEGNAWAVKMTLPEGKKSAQLTAGLFRFWDKTYPSPGGTKFKVVVYDASGTAGMPGKIIAGPYNAEAVRDKNVWTTVDLSEYDITVPENFYVVYLQSEDNPFDPGLCCDENGPKADRSYSCTDGLWNKYPDHNNLMIRAAVSFEAPVPVITSPENNAYTNKDRITVRGTASESFDVHILNNDKEDAVVRPGKDGSFSADIPLEKGSNIIKAYSSYGSEHTVYSDNVNVTLDTTAPVLNITSPEANARTNAGDVTVHGTVVEENLDNIKVNGTAATVNADGTWNARILLNEGENTIEAVATDKAGNKTSSSIKVDVKYSIREITNLTPDHDIHLNTGDSVKVEFDSEPGLKKAVFTIYIPLCDNSVKGRRITASQDSLAEIPMTETVDANGKGTGHYTGYWTATSKGSVSGAKIEVKLTDWYGNTLSKYASGKLNINVPLDVNFDNLQNEMKVNTRSLKVTGKLNYAVKKLIINDVNASMKDDLTFSADITLPYTTNKVTVKAIDYDGTVLKDYAVTVYCDTEAPVMNITAPVVNSDGYVFTNKDSITFNGTIYDDTFGYKLYINDQVKLAVDLPEIGGKQGTMKSFGYEIPVTDGCQVKVKAVDKFGNETAAKVYNVVVDKTAPVITVTGIEDGKTYTSEVLPTVKSNEGTLTMTLDGKNYNGDKITASGDHELDIKAVDAAGNTSNQVLKFRITSAQKNQENPTTGSIVKTGSVINTGILMIIAALFMAAGAIFVFGRKRSKGDGYSKIQKY